MEIKLPIEPGAKVDVVREWQFPVLVKARRELAGIKGDAVLDHVRVHTFGLYAVVKFDDQTYTIPYDRVVRVGEETEE